MDGAEANRKVHFLELRLRPRVGADPRPRHRQVGSLAGAAHLSNDNASSIGRLHREQRDANNKGFKMASKSHREDSRWRLSPLGRIQDGGGDVIEDDIIQDGGLIYS